MNIKIRFIHSRGTFPHNLVRWIIRKRTRSRWNHCVVVLSDNKIVETSHCNGVEIKEDRLPAEYLHIETNIEELDFLDWLGPRLGRPFDFPGLIAQLLPGCRWRREGCYICSTLIADYFRSDHGHEFDRAMTPQSLYEFLTNETTF